jgi:hypothetical protein
MHILYAVIKALQAMMDKGSPEGDQPDDSEHRVHQFQAASVRVSPIKAESRIYSRVWAALLTAVSTVSQLSRPLICSHGNLAPIQEGHATETEDVALTHSRYEEILSYRW